MNLEPITLLSEDEWSCRNSNPQVSATLVNRRMQQLSLIFSSD